MDRIKRLNLYQKAILLLLAVMAVVFVAVYFVVSSREGFEYRGSILQPRYENGSTVYSGHVKGENASFTVTDDKAVTYRHGEKIYGPYTAVEEPTAIPENLEMAKYMTGVEIRVGEEIFFRGGVLVTGNNDSEMMLYDEDGNFASLDMFVTSEDVIIRDSKGNVIDQLEPSETAILRLMSEPELTSKGDWRGWFCGMFISLILALFILFADEIFRQNLAFRIRNVEQAEPSEWEIASRYICWTVLTVCVLVLYILGLQA